jgi:predicted lysophospholipase L1 biosynthesis ABC-type transport system permease subunit
MAAAVIAVGVVPPFRSRTARRMIAWEVLVLATLPAAARAFGYFVGPTAYLSVAALALVVAVELDEFTTVRMTPAFAVGFVVLLTMAAAGLWTIARYFSDLYFGTTLIGGQTAANWDLVAATGIGLAAGGVFELYFRRLSPHTRLDFERWGEEP